MIAWCFFIVWCILSGALFIIGLVEKQTPPIVPLYTVAIILILMMTCFHFYFLHGVFECARKKINSRKENSLIYIRKKYLKGEDDPRLKEFSNYPVFPVDELENDIADFLKQPTTPRKRISVPEEKNIQAFVNDWIDSRIEFSQQRKKYEERYIMYARSASHNQVKYTI